MDIRGFGAQPFREPDRLFNVLVEVDEANAGASGLQRAAYFPIRVGIMVQGSQYHRSRYRRHEIRDRLVSRRIEADSYDSDSGRHVNLVHVHLLPDAPGTPLSNCPGSSGAIGIRGSSGSGAGSAIGSTMVGVTITSSSEFRAFIDLDRKS